MSTNAVYEERRRTALSAAALRAHRAGQTWEQFSVANRGNYRHREPRPLAEVQREALWLLELLTFGHSDIQPGRAA